MADVTISQLSSQAPTSNDVFPFSTAVSPSTYKATLAQIKTGLSLTKTDVGLSNVENKSSVTIRSEITSSNVTTALGYTPISNNSSPTFGNPTINGIGISYAASAVRWGIGGNLIAFGWASPTLYASVDDAVLFSVATVSDYRLKSNVKDLEDSMNKIMSLRPISYNAKHDKDGVVNLDKEYSGLIAHEVEKIKPAAVLGKKDAILEDGKPSYQTVDYSSFIPEIIKCIQELKQENDMLKSKILSLESAK